MWIFMYFAAEILIQGAAKILFSVLPQIWLHDNICKILNSEMHLAQGVQRRDCKPLRKRRREMCD